jgi:hypothetical protein
MILEELMSIPEHERRLALESIADDTISEHSYSRSLSDDEMAALRFNLESESIKLANLQDELVAFRNQLNASIKKHKAEVRSILYSLRNRTESVTGEVFLVADHELGRMQYVTPTGEIIYHRPLTAPERQGNVFKLAK